MKLKQIIDSTKSLIKLYSLDDISRAEAFTVGLIIKQMNPSLQVFDEQINKLNNKYKLNQESNVEERQKYNQEVNSLLEQNVPLKFKKIKIEIDNDKSGLSASDFDNLVPFVNIEIKGFDDFLSQYEEVEI